MTAFAFGVTTPTEAPISTALGIPGAGNTFSSPTDIGKAVKMSTAQNYILCAAGDDIEGFVSSVESIQVNGGYSFGGVFNEGRVLAQVGAAQVGNIAVGAYVVADVQLALGTAGTAQQWSSYPGTAPGLPTGPTAQVKAGTPVRYFWRVIRIVTGAGAAGSQVLLERL